MGLGGIKVLAYFLPGLFINVRCFLGKGMNPPMDIGIVPTVIVHNGIYHLLRGLGSSGIVQIHQGIPIDLSIQYWKVLSYT